MSTTGISRKLLAALVAACGAQLTALVVQVIATGRFDRVAAAQLVGAALTAVFGFAAGFVKREGAPTVVDADPQGSPPVLATAGDVRQVG